MRSRHSSSSILTQYTQTKQVNLTQEAGPRSANNVAGAVAYKQAQKYVVLDADEDIIRDKLETSASMRSKNSATTSESSMCPKIHKTRRIRSNSLSLPDPLMIVLIVMVACVVGLVLVFAAIKIHTSRILFGNKRKSIINEENPQMEWDDSGLNITENPLETLEVNS